MIVIHLQHQDEVVEEAVEEEVEVLVTRIEDLVEEEEEDLTTTTEVVVGVAVPTTVTSKWIISEMSKVINDGFFPTSLQEPDCKAFILLPGASIPKATDQ